MTHTIIELLFDFNPKHVQFFLFELSVWRFQQYSIWNVGKINIKTAQYQRNAKKYTNIYAMQ